jgi:hypothetical protein
MAPIDRASQDIVLIVDDVPENLSLPMILWGALEGRAF